jgi:hypothetical protein
MKKKYVKLCTTTNNKQKLYYSHKVISIKTNSANTVAPTHPKRLDKLDSLELLVPDLGLW